MLRRSLAALATAFSAVAVVAVPLAPAQAAGTCTLTPPSRIAIYKDVTELPTSITGDCGGGYWETPGTSLAALDPSSGFDSPTIVVFDTDSPYGRSNWEPRAAVVDPYCDDEADSVDQRRQGSGFAEARKLADRAPGSTQRAQSAAAPCEYVDQNTNAYSDIRLGTYGAISGTRNSASKVTFTVTSAIWSTGLDKLINRSMKGVLQTQYADGTWHNVGNTITTAANGKSTFSVGLPRRTWRFAVYSTPYSFDRVSTAITR